VSGVGGGKIPAVVIVGRPNVGKSTLFNRLIGDERSIVHDMAGTTRDAIDTVVETAEGKIRFVDTAGMRRKSRIDEGAEYFSLVRALQAIDAADAALFVIDAVEGVTHQDQRLAERIDAAGCPIVIVLNKWDLLDNDARIDSVHRLEDRLAFLSYAPILKVSAQSGTGVHKLLPALSESISQYHMRVPTRELNELVAEAQQAHPSREARVLYATQGATDPPTFTLFANREMSPQYLRYLERRIREKFNFGSTPIKLRVRKRD
jgi:GTPase